ncbi:hypothetical protein [Micromonospora zhanjiangensis]
MLPLLSSVPGVAEPGPVRPRRTDARWRLVALSLLVACACGPYLVAGLRTEQASVYLVCGVGLVCGWWRSTPAAPNGLLVVYLLGFELVIALFGWLFPAPPTLEIGWADEPLRALDNLVMPGAVLFATWMLLGAWVDPRPYLRAVCGVIVALACVNTGLAFLSVTFDLTPLLQGFWVQGELTPSVAALALSTGRYGGIFNQPAEGGHFYSIALLSLIYLFHRRPWWLAAAAAVVILGGTLGASKTFLLGGLPVGVWQILRTAGRRPTWWLGAAGVGSVVYGLLRVAAGHGVNWNGLGVLATYFAPADDADLVHLYSAGRFGDHAALYDVTIAILKTSPWTGYGLNGVGWPYDSAWLGAFAVGGLLGVFAYTAVLCVLLWSWWRRRPSSDPNMSRLAGGLVLVTITSSLGYPALSGNRAATPMWVLFALLLLSRRIGSRDGRRDPGEAEARIKFTNYGVSSP